MKLKVPEAPTATVPNRARFTVRKGMVLEIGENFDQTFRADDAFTIVPQRFLKTVNTLL